ncbi:MAG: hypothetical protein QFB86_01510 [Patescibacteria group bacterium]|nr:hypothetical protein [Patescibacteria group bacterium]
MSYIKGFITFWYKFIVGDDWRIAIGVITGLGISAALVHKAHLQLWWLLPTGVVVMLALSLWLAVRKVR